MVTNDRWTDHGRHSRQAREVGLPGSSWATDTPSLTPPNPNQAREAVRWRTIRFTWIREVFAPAADDLGRFGRAEGV